jgi:hypothetical protein
MPTRRHVSVTSLIAHASPLCWTTAAVVSNSVVSLIKSFAVRHNNSREVDYLQNNCLNITSGEVMHVEPRIIFTGAVPGFFS